MHDPAQVSRQIEQTFNKIHIENMQGIPILNPAIEVQALGFQEIEGRVLGIIITPWLMNVVILPKDDEDWGHMQLGDKRPHEFASRTYKFMLNEIDGIGLCQTHSLYSPMREFRCHEQAIAAAQAFLDGLLEEHELSEDEQVDEELLGKVMRGEATPEIDLNEFAGIEPAEADLKARNDRDELKVEDARKITRRNMLRGNFG